ncbi:hypothetical protein EMA8858_01451 [Emticicia aquatica]|jgi:hypothetical protein|uniref:DUF5683 domain-containing protein n=1 Tax=Emticicia aquatica TaxID=1681835 RepID=A0ABM9ANJ0_9BACT|nr:DUF5683 domain-containing protein [Emticicia aquatica]CAH0995330.1 hypothetical protein EMA8858_01451 [Emticicia aquatica]
MTRFFIVLLLASSCTFAQKLDTAKVLNTQKAVIDTAKKVNFLTSIIKKDSSNKRSIPRTVLLRSLILPGWGQATNKQYWIIPVVYGAAAGGVYAIWWNNSKYKFYKSYLSQIVVDKKTEVYIPVNGELRGPYVQTQIEPAVKSYHRQRDLSWIGLAVGWTLQAIQANVSAHLKGFDMSDDISLKFEPNIQPTSFGSAVGVKIGLNF